MISATWICIVAAWVVGFPLFDYDDKEGRWVSCHHPFTSPRSEDLDHLESGVRVRVDADGRVREVESAFEPFPPARHSRDE